MLDLLLSYTKGYNVPRDASASTSASALLARCIVLPIWKRLLLTAVEMQCHALIDSGALLAGVPTHTAAIFLSSYLPESVVGVTYYDTRKMFDCWVVLDKARQLVTPLKNSPVHERDTFVIFDEARSRGSDMKLLSDACALLTLGPKMTKDKLMQGAGRLRQLGCDQKLWLTSTGEVERSIRQATGCESASISVAEVLHWVVESTQQLCTLGLLEWAQSAVDFCGKESDSKLELKKDDWSLEGQYAAAQVPMKISDIVHERIAAYRMRHSSRILVQVENRATTYARDDTVLVTTYGEECERELQVEREKELELRKPNDVRKPREETDWGYTVLLGATSIAPLTRTFDLARTFFALQDVIRSFLAGSLFHRIAWRDTQIDGTSNFWQTVLAPTFFGSVNNDFGRYLRMIDVFIVFPDLSVLLLTKREADAVAKLLSSTPASPGGRFRIVHLEFLFSAVQRHGPDVTLSDVPLSIGYPDDRALANIVLPPLVLMACRLFNGDTDFLSRTHPRVD
ncbi:hypothetical protein Poli38472_013240 [Pythium oligandrum]|uniref:ubiquitinyl hydrolase 1 n=1 Tax=Pythium oligandrum TaxID=41045 RepID=A0A8K1FC05_PYTOL|nr:hypothetical protein Poli38472_013240 [Pythium oligandrum]|eukprot:TMW55349.1 hypothetical protein Poli38472_013240 [Pythium oligandrum]